MTRQDAAAAAAAAGDIGHRIASRREELGLSPEETTERAGIARATCGTWSRNRPRPPGSATLHGPATALGTSASALRRGCRLAGGARRTGRSWSNSAPGVLGASLHPRGRQDRAGHARRARRPAGRLHGRRGRDRLPHLCGRHARGSRGHPVRVRGRPRRRGPSEGWSVLVRGVASAVTDPRAVRELAEREYGDPWAGGERDLWIRPVPAGVTGRRIAVGWARGPPPRPRRGSRPSRPLPRPPGRSPRLLRRSAARAARAARASPGSGPAVAP